MSRKLGEDEWLEVLNRLAQVLPPDHQRHVTVIGGVAMALAYGSRRTTEDADVIMPPEVAAEVLPAAEKLAPEFGLPSHWMNQKAVEAGYASAPPEGGRVVLSTPSLVLEVPSTERLLGMKLARFAGDTDIEDAKILAMKLRNAGRSTAEDVWDVVGGTVPMASRGRARHNLENLWEMLDEPA